MSEVRHVEIHPEYTGQRLDNYLSREWRGVPRTLLYRLLRQGQIRVNGGRAKPAYRLQAGDRLRLPPVREERGGATKPSTRVLERLAVAVVYEDDNLIVLNKPSGLAVHGGSGLGYGVIEAMRQLRVDCPFLDLAHRLDRDTSGCLVIAKRRAALKAMHEMLREGGADKRYLTLLCGRLPDPTVRVDAPLEQYTRRGGESMMRVGSGGKTASTVFHRSRVAGQWTLAEVELRTGRTHQIRVHASHLTLPIAGDRRYGDKRWNQRARAAGLKRLFLHAASLRLPQAGGPALTVEAPLPAALKQVLETLSSDQN